MSGGVRGPVLLAKGPADLVCLPTAAAERGRYDAGGGVAWLASSQEGSPRRCGGQGDVLAGERGVEGADGAGRNAYLRTPGKRVG
jgi:hypothetical protein